jgi:stage V sporulation protein G
MEITEVKVFPVQEEKLKAFVSVVFDHCFMVNDIKVIQGRDGLFISMPSRRKKNGEFKDVAHPLNNDCRKMIEGRILEQYDRMVAPDRRQEAEEAQHGIPAAVAKPHRGGPGRSSPRVAAVRSVGRPARGEQSGPQRSDVAEPASVAAASAGTDRRERSQERPVARPASERWHNNGHKVPEPRPSPKAQDRPEREVRVVADSPRGDRPRAQAAPAASSEEVDAGGSQEQRKSLKEVEEMHLRDSFWTVP